LLRGWPEVVGAGEFLPVALCGLVLWFGSFREREEKAGEETWMRRKGWSRVVGMVQIKQGRRGRLHALGAVVEMVRTTVCFSRARKTTGTEREGVWANFVGWAREGDGLCGLQKKKRMVRLGQREKCKGPGSEGLGFSFLLFCKLFHKLDLNSIQTRFEFGTEG
jgi:hypothetical protein